MDLFIERREEETTKVAAETTLPDDPNTWPNEILQEVFKQVPYVADFEPNVVVDRVNAESGYGFGHIEVMNKTEIQRGASQEGMQAAGVRQVRLPFVIKDKKLQPIDILITEDSRMMPLTESRLRQAIFRPQAFDITGRTPGDMSMIGQLYPPYRQNYGFGGGGASMSAGMGKDGSAKTASVLAAILPTINEADYDSFIGKLASPQLRAAYLANSDGTAPALLTLSKYEPVTTSKLASAVGELARTKVSVAQVQKDVEGYVLKTANHQYWEPIAEHINRGQLVQLFGEKVALAADTNGSVTMTEGATVEQAQPEADRPELIKDYGVYRVKDENGKDLLGWVFPNLIDVDGTALPIALFTNGSETALQGEIYGVRSGEGLSLPDDVEPSGHGCFVQVLPNGKAQAMVPMDIQGNVTETHEGATEAAVMATTFDGRQVELHIGQPNIQGVAQSPDGDIMIPETFKWLPLDGQGTSLAGAEVQDAQAKAASVCVTIRAGGVDSFSISGSPVEKLAADERSFISFDDALFLLGGLGVDPNLGIQKLSEAVGWSRPVDVSIGRELSLASDLKKEAHAGAQELLEHIPNLRRDLVKEAADIPDPTAVDTVLSLGFINPENLSTFIGYLPKIDESQSKLCEILMAARLGLREVPTGPIEKAIKATEEVLEGLKVMAFQQLS